MLLERILQMRFGELLKTYINESDVSTRMFSQITGLNRGWLYNIFSGKKSLPEDKFFKLLEIFPFSAEQNVALRDAYWSDFYGRETFSKIKYILSEFKKHNERSDDDFLLSNSKKVYDKDFIFLFSKDELTDAMTFLLNKNAADSDSCIYTNFSYEHECLDNLFYSCVLKNSMIQYYHMVNFDISINNSVHNLRNIFSSIKYAANKVNTYYFHTNTNTVAIDNLFPYFIVSTHGVILYDETLNSGLFIQIDNIVFQFIEKSIILLNSCDMLVSFPESAFDMTDIIFNNEHFSSCCVSFSSEPCMTLLLTHEILDAIGLDSVPNRDAIISGIDLWIKTMNSETPSAINFNSVKGFNRFAKEGYVNHFPKEYAKAIPIEFRSQILKQCIDNERSPQAFNIVDSKSVSLPDNLTIELTPSNLLIIYGCFDDSSSYLAEYSISIKDTIVFNDFMNLKDYLLRNRMIMDKAHKDFFLNSLIINLEKTD